MFLDLVQKWTVICTASARMHGAQTDVWQGIKWGIRQGDKPATNVAPLVSGNSTMYSACAVVLYVRCWCSQSDGDMSVANVTSARGVASRLI